MSLIKKISKKKNERKKYSFISIDDLKKLESRGIQLTEELKNIDFQSDPYTFKNKSMELYNIISDLKKYKKYAKNK